MGSRLLRFAFVGLLLASVTACSPYVNVPAQPGDALATNNPNNVNVRDAVVEAVLAVLLQRPEPGAYQLVMPRGTEPLTYAAILPRLGDQAMWSSAGVTPDVPVIEIRQVRIRGTSAAVDLVRPVTPGLNDPEQRELVTVYLNRYLPGGWRAGRIRVWRGDVDEALRLSPAPTADEQPAPMPGEQAEPAPQPAPTADPGAAAMPLVESSAIESPQQ